MSTLKVIEKAALSLPGNEQRELLGFLTVLIGKNAAKPEAAVPVAQPHHPVSLHPALLPMVGIIPDSAVAEEIHDYRLLKHS